MLQLKSSASCAFSHPPSVIFACADAILGPTLLATIAMEIESVVPAENLDANALDRSLDAGAARYGKRPSFWDRHDGRNPATLGISHRHAAVTLSASPRNRLSIAAISES